MFPNKLIPSYGLTYVLVSWPSIASVASTIAAKAPSSSVTPIAVTITVAVAISVPVCNTGELESMVTIVAREISIGEAVRDAVYLGNTNDAKAPVLIWRTKTTESR